MFGLSTNIEGCVWFAEWLVVRGSGLFEEPLILQKRRSLESSDWRTAVPLFSEESLQMLCPDRNPTDTAIGFKEMDDALYQLGLGINISGVARGAHTSFFFEWRVPCLPQSYPEETMPTVRQNF